MQNPDHATLCEGAFACLKQCLQLLEKPNGLRSRVPLLYLQQTLERAQDLKTEAVVTCCVSGGRDGLSFAKLFQGVLSALSLLFSAADERVAVEPKAAADVGGTPPGSDFRFFQVAVQLQEQRLLVLLGFIDSLLDSTVLGWPEALASCLIEDMLASGDFAALWTSHFPHRLRAGSKELVRALRTTRNKDLKACEELLLWLQPDEQDEIELLDAALVLDGLGISRGFAFCTKWEELCGQAFVTALWSDRESGRRSVATSADLVQARRERESSVLMPGWSRVALRDNRPLLQGLLALGATIACDCNEGLAIHFEEADVAKCIVPPGSGPAGAKSRVGDALIALGKLAESQGPEVCFSALGRDNIPSRCAGRLVQEKYSLGCARLRHDALTRLKGSKLDELNGFIHVFEALGTRQRKDDESRARACNPVFRSEAWPLLEATRKEQRAKEEEVLRRKRSLEHMENASENPDQIAHIRALLQEVSEAEAEADTSGEWFKHQEVVWIREEEQFQRARRREDLGGRQRLTAMFLDFQRRQRQRGEVRAEMTRIEAMLSDLEETFSMSRQRLHGYDHELMSLIDGKESFLAALSESLGAMRALGELADEAAQTGAEDLDRLQRILFLHAAKAQQIEEIDAFEKKLDAHRVKHNAVLGAPL